MPQTGAATVRLHHPSGQNVSIYSYLLHTCMGVQLNALAVAEGKNKAMAW